MDDAISRQAALIECCHSCDGWNCNPNTCCKTEWIRKLPTIQPNIEKWIPVTERLPEENQPVLITDGAVMWVCSLIRTDDSYKWESNMGYWYDFDEWSAWMPLPEPYKGATT